jgi:hypothetical protein
MIMPWLHVVLTMSAFCVMADSTPRCAEVERQIEQTYRVLPTISSCCET